MNKLISKETLKIISMFLIWRITLVVVLIFAFNFVGLATQDRYLGGGFNNYLLGSSIFPWANFDGEHYLSISIFGYKPLEQAFFPVYPLLISFFSLPFIFDSFSALMVSTIVGLIISNGAFLLALIYLWKLIKLDYPQKIAFTTLSLLLVFPLSFYFGALYSESLFLLLSVLSFLNARKGHWVIASFFGLIASATRVFGVLIFPSLLIELYMQKGKKTNIFWLLLIPLGLIFYMGYQYVLSGDAFAFYNLQTVVGPQHQKGIILLPQVYFRYIKMIFTTDMSNPIYQTIILEFLTGIIFFLLPLFGYFKKVRLSYLFFTLSGMLIPSIQGSFSSLPRYVIVFFPSFLAAAILISNWPKIFKVILFIILSFILCFETVLFVRGYWVA